MVPVFRDFPPLPRRQPPKFRAVYTERLSRSFGFFDTNRDGSIDATEARRASQYFQDRGRQNSANLYTALAVKLEDRDPNDRYFDDGKLGYRSFASNGNELSDLAATVGKRSVFSYADLISPHFKDDVSPPPPPPPPPPPLPVGSGYALSDVNKLFDKADANKDGRLERYELDQVEIDFSRRKDNFEPQIHSFLSQNFDRLQDNDYFLHNGLYRGRSYYDFDRHLNRFALTKGQLQTVASYDGFSDRLSQEDVDLYGQRPRYYPLPYDPVFISSDNRDQAVTTGPSTDATAASTSNTSTGTTSSTQDTTSADGTRTIVQIKTAENGSVSNHLVID